MHRRTRTKKSLAKSVIEPCADLTASRSAAVDVNLHAHASLLAHAALFHPARVPSMSDICEELCAGLAAVCCASRPWPSVTS
jgi:hypothetical protein